VGKPFFLPLRWCGIRRFDSSDDLTQLHHRLLDLLRPRVANVEPDEILKALLGGEDRAGGDADVLRQRSRFAAGNAAGLDALLPATFLSSLRYDATSDRAFIRRHPISARQEGDF
jgi:hypothetical protein